MLSAVATRYARALADVMAAADPAQTLAQLRGIEQIIQVSSDLRNALASPAVPPTKKRAVMARLIQPLGVSPQVRNFVFVVIDHRRVHEFASIIEAFEILADQRLGLVRADVTSARELTEAQRGALQTQLSRLSGKRARLQFATDPAVLGGVVARVGSTVYDGSVRGQFERLRVKLGST